MLLFPLPVTGVVVVGCGEDAVGVVCLFGRGEGERTDGVIGRDCTPETACRKREATNERGRACW